MVPPSFDERLSSTPLWVIGAALLVAMAGASLLGFYARRRREAYLSKAGSSPRNFDGREGYIVSAILGLFALLLGFTFSLAIDRFETRRALVLDEANAIETAYLRAQLLDTFHRERISCLLIVYTDNRLALARATPVRAKSLLFSNDTLIAALWASTMEVFPSIRPYDFSSVFIESINNLIDLDGARKAARTAHIPADVFFVLFVYVTVTALVLGYVFVGFRGWLSGAILYVLFSFALVLVIDIDRPVSGGIRESQGPMQRLRESFLAEQRAGRAPPSVDCVF